MNYSLKKQVLSRDEIAEISPETGIIRTVDGQELPLRRTQIVEDMAETLIAKTVLVHPLPFACSEPPIRITLHDIPRQRLELPA